jgi:Flp pilus assembly protein CpaB
MRRGRIFIYLALILILGVVAVFVVYTRFIQPRQAAEVEAPVPTPVIDTVDVVIATQIIPRGAILDETVLSTVEMPRDLFIEGMFSDLELVVGRQAKFDLDSGIPITAKMLADEFEQLSTIGSLWALQIPQGYVAVSVPISRLSSVSYGPRPGDHVNVIMTLMFIDVDSEFQTRLPNQISGVVAPGPGIIIGTDVSETADVDDEGGAPDKATFEEAKQGASVITAQLAPGGALAMKGRTELDPLLNELFFVVPQEKQRARIVSQTFLQDVMVLQIGTFPTAADEEQMREEAEAEAEAAATTAAAGEQQQQAQRAQQAAEEPVEEEKPKPPDVITLVVKPQDAVTLNYLLYSGAELTLALRAAGDDATPTTEAATLQYLLDTYNIPVPAKLPYGQEPGVLDLQLPTLINDIPEE